MDRRIVAGAGSDFYRQLLEVMTDGVSLCTEDGILVYTNGSEDRMFGYDRGELVGQHVSVQNAEPPERNAALVAETIAALKRTGSWQGEWRNRRKDGAAFQTSAHITAVEFEGARHWLCVRRDVSREISIRRELEESRSRLDLATQAGNIGVWDWDLTTNEMIYSERAKQIFGFPPGLPVTFEQVRDATHPDDLPRTMGLARQALDPNVRGREPYEYRLLRPDGAERWVIAHGEAIFSDDNPRALRYVGTIQDINDRKLAVAALEDSEARLRLALHAGRMAVWEYRSATDSIVGSPELNELLGFPRDRIISAEELRSRYAPGERERVQAIGREALERGDTTMEAEVKFLLPGNVTRWLMMRAEFTWKDNHPAPGALGVVVDITAQKEAERHLRLVVGELNHRVKNTLAVVQSISAQTRLGASDPLDAHVRFESRLQALSRAHDILTAGYWDRVGFEQIVAASVSPHVGEAGHRLVLDGTPVSIEPKLALSLSLVLHELATNALKYGALTSETGRVELRWSVDGDGDAPSLSITWRELGGPAVQPPQRKGFGSRVIERSFGSEPGASARLDFPPEGIVCTIVTPLSGEA